MHGQGRVESHIGQSNDMLLL